MSKPNECTICGRKHDTRFSFCFDCAEAQNIIGTGVDMNEINIFGKKKYRGFEGLCISPVDANLRLKFLIKKGWKPPQ